MVVQPRVGGSPRSNRFSASAAARCVACHGLGAHALPACDVSECSNPLGKNIARVPGRRSVASVALPRHARDDVANTGLRVEQRCRSRSFEREEAERGSKKPCTRGRSMSECNVTRE